jgi:hypothetical protein
MFASADGRASGRCTEFLIFHDGNGRRGSPTVPVYAVLLERWQLSLRRDVQPVKGDLFAVLVEGHKIVASILDVSGEMNSTVLSAVGKIHPMLWLCLLR